jgi:hypothetical protein
MSSLLGAALVLLVNSFIDLFIIPGLSLEEGTYMLKYLIRYSYVIYQSVSNLLKGQVFADCQYRYTDSSGRMFAYYIYMF